MRPAILVSSVSTGMCYELTVCTIVSKLNLQVKSSPPHGVPSVDVLCGYWNKLDHIHIYGDNLRREGLEA
jgi:hypothetical protein